MQDRRRFPRLDMNIPVTMRHSGRLKPATMINVSNGGMMILAEDADISFGSPVEVIFDLNDGQKDLSLTGRIMRVEADHKATCLGIQLINLFSASHKKVRAYIDELPESNKTV